MIKDESLIRDYLDNSLSDTEVHYVKKRLKEDLAFKKLYDQISLYYTLDTTDEVKEETEYNIPNQPLPKKYALKYKLLGLFKILVVIAILWLIISYLLG